MVEATPANLITAIMAIPAKLKLNMLIM